MKADWSMKKLRKSWSKVQILESPITIMLSALCGNEEPPLYVKGIDFSNLTEDQFLELQGWAASNCFPSWGTGIGTLEAAEKLVKEAIGNVNIVQNDDGEWEVV